MAKTIAAYSVDLTARTSGFTAEWMRAEQTAARVGDRIKGIASNIGGALAGIGAGISVGAFASLVHGAVMAQDKTDELAQRIGLTTEATSKLGVAARFTATDLEGVGKAMNVLNRNAVAAAAGTKEQAAAFNAVGVSVTDMHGKLRAGDQILADLAERFEGYEDGAAKSALAIKLLGKAGADIIPLLNEGKEGLADYARMAEQFGLVVSTSTGKAAALYADNLDKIRLAGEGVANVVATEISPALADLSSEIVRYLRGDEWQQWLATVRSVASGIADNLGRIVDGVRVVGEIAVAAIGLKFVGACASAAINVGLLMAGAVRATATAGSLGAAWTVAGGNIVASTMASVKAIGLIPLAINGVGAAFAGWEIGKYLRDNFVEVRVAGVALVEGLLVGWERIKEGARITWAAIKFAAAETFDYITQKLSDEASSWADALDWTYILPGNELVAAKLRETAQAMAPAAASSRDLASAIAAIRAESDQAVASIRATTHDMAEYEHGTQAATDALRVLDKTLDLVDAKSGGKLAAGTKEYAAALAQINAARDVAIQRGAVHADVEERVKQTIDGLAQTMRGAAPNIADFVNGQTDAERSAKALADETMRAAIALSKSRAELDPSRAAAEAYYQEVMEIVAAYQKMRANGMAAAAATAIVEQRMRGARASFQAASDQMARQRDVLSSLKEQWADDRSLALMSERQREIERAVRAATEEYQRRIPVAERVEQDLRAIEAAARDTAATTYDLREAYRAAEEQARRYADIVRNAFEGATDAIAQWAVDGFSHARDFWRGMVDLVKRAVADMLSEWLKTRVIGAFFGGGSAGGGGTGNLIAAGAQMLAGGGSGGSSSSIPGAAVQATGGFDYGSLFSPSSWMDAGRSLWAGFTTPGATAGSTILGSYTGAFGGIAYSPSAASPLGLVPNYAGGAPGVGVGVSSGSYAYTPSALGTTLGVVGGAYAGYQRYQNSNGGVPGALGAAAYGIGTMGLVGAAGGALAAGSIAGAGAGMAGAMGAVGMIPVIGWIAAIAMLVDMLAGGKLFGTSARTQYMDSRLTLGAAGPTASLQETTVRQRSLFRGREWSTHSRAATPEMLEAAREFWEQMAEVSRDVARATMSAVAPVIDASLRSVTEYDKKGRVKATKWLVETIGRTWEEATQELAARRIAAEQMIASVDAGLKTPEASGIAERYRRDAEQLAEAAAAMVQASADLRQGRALLGAGDSLTSVMAWVEQQRQANESLSTTYGRLAQATAQYNALVQQTNDALAQSRVGTGPVEQMQAALTAIDRQMRATIEQLNAAAVAAGLTVAAEADLAAVRTLAAQQVNAMATAFGANIEQQLAALSYTATPANDFAAAMRAIQQQYRDNVAQANALARAQGLAGATTERLARITELAARQGAAAIMRLQSIGQSQVRSLYGGAFTLDQVNTDITELQSRANAAAGAVQDFGGAIADTANAATSAVNLLLGQLSPLNDQQKLQYALSGLSSGAVSQEQVLEIGRRLYASSAQYTALFNQVMAMGGRIAGAAAGAGGATRPAQAQGLTEEEQRRLKELLLQRDELMRQQRVNEARDLATTIAALAAAQGKTFEEIAKQLGLDLARLARDLGLGDQDALLQYLGGIDVSGDDLGDTFTDGIDRLIAVMDRYWGVPKPTDPAATKDETERAPRDAALERALLRSNELAERSGNELVSLLQEIANGVDGLRRELREATAAPRSTRYA